MRAVVQRVTHARVTVSENTTGEIQDGLLVLLGVAHEDTAKDIDYMVRKILHLRIFEDEHGKMNKSVQDIQGSVLAVSQFTLYGDCRKGRRPSFISAARPEKARTLFDEFVQHIRDTGTPCETGQFQATMDVTLNNHGPVTILLDSARNF